MDAYSHLWRSLAAKKPGPETDAIIRTFFEQHGIQVVTWKDRFLRARQPAPHDEIRVNRIFLTHDHPPEKLRELGEAHRHTDLRPPYDKADSFCGMALRLGQPYAYSQLPSEERPFLEFLYSENANVTGMENRDSVCVPLPRNGDQHMISTINFGLGRTVKESEIGVFVQLASLLSSLWIRAPEEVPSPARFREKEMEALKWAIAGKTLEEISIITSIPVRSIRYYLYKVRDHYGYATVQQTLVRVAKDFGIDP